MPRQFWNRENTELSFRTLQSVKGKVDFVLIGGWAVYYYTGRQRSEDIDMAIGYDSLRFFRRYGIHDYGGINIKYSVVDGTVVDLFLEEHADADLPVPVSVILREYILLEGVKVVNRELLLLLKLWGYFREDETKFRKDIVDVLALLFYSGLELGKFKGYVTKYDIERRRSSDALLEYLDRGEHLSAFVCDTDREYASLKAKKKREIERLFGRG